jgi:hypothetical protein
LKKDHKAKVEDFKQIDASKGRERARQEVKKLMVKHLRDDE